MLTMLRKSFQELFAKEVVDNTIKKTVTIQESNAINKGGGQFEIKVLPKEVQFPLWMPFVRWISIKMES
jgi:hypothetical protein